MKIIITIFIFIATGFCGLSYGQNSYRIKSFSNKGEFIYPPHSKLKQNSQSTNLKERYRYHYVYIDSLKMIGGDYYSVLNLLNKAEYFTNKNDIDKICFDTECHGCTDGLKGGEKKSFDKSKRKLSSKEITKLKNNPAITIKETGSEICAKTPDTIGDFCKIKYSYDHKAFLLRIDYEKVFTNDPDKEITDQYNEKKLELEGLLKSYAHDNDKLISTNKTISELTKEYKYNISPKGIIEKRFFEIAKDLLIEFSKRENDGSDGFGWPSSISQNLVEKIFELIPIPQKASLTRYISQIDYNKSFVLLNPKIKLKIDAAEKVKEGSNWYFNLLGETIITINRDNKGKIIQNPFHKFQVNGMPDNIVKDKIVLQASTEDIQLSESLKECPFVFLWQNNFKQNNKASQPGGCQDPETDFINCNSQLWHFDKLNSFYKIDDLDYDSKTYISSYGYRNLITPIIDVIINGNVMQLPLGTSLNQLRNSNAVPLCIKFFRFWKGRYVKVNSKNIDNIILLPQDKITF